MPIQPPSKAMRKMVFSGILQSFLRALYLSAVTVAKPSRFIRISTVVIRMETVLMMVSPINCAMACYLLMPAVFLFTCAAITHFLKYHRKLRIYQSVKIVNVNQIIA